MLFRKQKYLQVALNNDLAEARQIISQLPPNRRIIIEAGTPLLKKEGAGAIGQIKTWWQTRLQGHLPDQTDSPKTIFDVLKLGSQSASVNPKTPGADALAAYVVADYKAMDRGTTEVQIAADHGADAITVLGQAPTETLNTLLEAGARHSLDVFIDMMNVEKPYQVLRKLKKLPRVVMLHRGVDETESGNIPLPIHQINKVKGSFDVLVAIGGGDTIREVQSAFFNGAEIVMVWKDFYEAGNNTAQIAEEFLKQVK